MRGADPNGRGGRGRGRPRSPGQRALASSPHAPSLGASFARVAHLRPRQKTAGNHGSSGGLHSSGLRQGSTGTVGVEISGPRGPKPSNAPAVQKSGYLHGPPYRNLILNELTVRKWLILKELALPPWTEHNRGQRV